jgi:amino acid transporter
MGSTHDTPTPIPLTRSSKFRPTAILCTTAMLSFISFWKAGAIVLCDLGSSAFYAGGIAEQAIGKAAPWFILGIMLFSNCVRMVYIESCSMFVRGGVYKVVKRAMGGTLAKIAVSALMFDYVLTGPISAVSAGQYLVSFLNQLLGYFHIQYLFPHDSFSVLFALLVTFYFWRKNIVGIEESSDKALKIIIATSVVGLILIGFSVATLVLHPQPLPPLKPVITDEALGWMKGFDWAKSMAAVGIMVAFGHSLLAMSGEESLAQVFREIEAPKLKNLMKAGVLIAIFSIAFTSLTTFFGIMIIPDSIRVKQYSDNLLGGLAMHVAAPEVVRFILHGLVVFVGFLILSGAVNTSMVGSNGVLNRVSEDGVLTDWFRVPHKRFGTTSRVLNLILILQVFTILACRGDIYALGEAYAFGVIWSFTFVALSMLILRFKDKSPREWKVPLNLKVGSIEIPIGLGLILLVLFSFAITNLFTKPIATQWGVAFSLSFFILFTLSERSYRKKIKTEELAAHGVEFHEKVNLALEENLNPEICRLIKSRRILVTARDPRNLYHVNKVLEEFDPDTTDCIVMTAKVAKPYEAEGDFNQLYPEEQSLLTHIVNLAEKAGKKVIPILVPASDPYFAIGKVAHDLAVEEVVMGLSGKMSVEQQMENFAISWGSIFDPNEKGVKLRAIWPGREFVYEI